MYLFRSTLLGDAPIKGFVSSRDKLDLISTPTDFLVESDREVVIYNNAKM